MSKPYNMCVDLSMYRLNFQMSLRPTIISVFLKIRYLTKKNPKFPMISTVNTTKSTQYIICDDSANYFFTSALIETPKWACFRNLNCQHCLTNCKVKNRVFRIPEARPSLFWIFKKQSNNRQCCPGG